MRAYNPDFPAPGSDKALDLGCTCPVLDNSHGKGIIINSVTMYWRNETCPLHGIRTLRDNGEYLTEEEYARIS